MNNLIETLRADTQFSTLVEAITTAGLGEVLSGPGPFTVFAPTNDAFAKIDPDTLKAVLADKEKLTSILTYHVVAGKVMAADVMTLTTATTVQGNTVAVDTTSGVKVNDAMVTATDIESTNGVIHVLDTVLMP